MGPFSEVQDEQRISLPSLGGKNYVLVVQDEYSRYCWVRILTRKSDATDAIVRILNLLRTQFPQHIIRRLHSDGGGEFVNPCMDEYLAGHGIERTYTTRDKPQHNGKVERLNQSLHLLVRLMLTASSGPQSLWGEAMVHAGRVWNATPLKVLDGVTPYERLTGLSPDHVQSKLKVFGCNAFYLLSKNARGKFQSCMAPGIWVGYSTVQNAHCDQS